MGLDSSLMRKALYFEDTLAFCDFVRLCGAEATMAGIIEDKEAFGLLNKYLAASGTVQSKGAAAFLETRARPGFLARS